MSALYRYFKQTRLNAVEKSRLRLSIHTERCLASPHKSSASTLANALIELFSNLDKMRDPNLIDWILSYGHSKLINRLLHSLAEVQPQQRSLQLVKNADSADLLPKEYISPDIQIIQSTPHPRRALICFCGGAHRLNMPVQMFHFLAAKRFDLILYLRDFQKQSFNLGITGIANNFSELALFLRQQIPSNCQVAVLGTSTGGFAAARLTEQIQVERLALFSSPFMFKNIDSLTQPANLSLEKVRLYFANTNLQDIKFADRWSKHGFGACCHWFNTADRGTLRNLFLQNKMDMLLNWLQGVTSENSVKQQGSLISGY
jgi:hypothetical protein